MKKTFAILLALLLTFGMYACGGNGNNEETAPTTVGCSHTYTDATCTEPKTCSKCGATEGNAIGHNWEDATCSAPKTCKICGLTEGGTAEHGWEDATCTTPKTCKICGLTEGGTAEHSWEDATCTAPKTCKACGATEGSATGHNWKDATCSAPKTCSKCRETQGYPLGHNWKDATCTSAESCSRCGYTTGSPLGHSWKEATCTAPKTCARCFKEEGSALGHTEVIDEAVPPTCTEPGLTEGRHCSVCNLVIQRQETINPEHKVSGDTCTVCHQRVPVGEWDASSNQDGSIIVYMYGTNNKDEYVIEVVGDGKMKDFDINGPHAPWAGTWYESKKVASLRFIGNITYIGAATFPYLEVQDLLLPNTLTHIGDYAFWGCATLDSVTLPDSLQIIGECAFSGCGLTTLHVPDNVIIKRQALCCLFDTLYLPRHVKIEDFGLGWNEDHKMEVYYNGTKEEWMATGNIEKYFYEDQIVHCTDGDYLTPGHYCH